MGEDVKKLELRIKELENKLKEFQGAAAPEELTKEEIAAYRKVSSALASFNDWECGINECKPIGICRVCSVCRVCRICRICINECTCGPCNICRIGGSGGGFSDFGG